MRRRGHICIYFLTGLALTASVGAFASDTPSTPYREIASRNSFGLKALPERPESPPVVSPRPKIRLIGITTILGRKMAFLVVTGSEPGRLRECLVLAEGQRQHEIEVTEIDEKGGMVKVFNRGEKQTLDFTENDDTPRIIDRPLDTPLTPERQSLLIEPQRVKAIQDGDPIAKILPPTDFTPETMDDY